MKGKLVLILVFLFALNKNAKSAEYVFTKSGTARVCSLYIPDKLTNIRGVYVNWKRGSETYMGENMGSIRQYRDQEWRDFLEGMGFAMMLKDGLQAQDGSARDGGGDFIMEALNSFATRSGHSELKFAPILMWGHSKSAGFAATFADMFPARTIGFIQFHGRNNNDRIDEAGATGKVPALLLAGQNDNILSPQETIDMLVAGRALGNPWSGGIELGLPHGGGTDAAFYVRKTIIHPWILSIVNKRLPENLPTYTAPVSLRPLTETSGYLGSLSDFSTSPFASYAGNKSQTSFLPDAGLAKVWSDYFKSGDAAGRAIKNVLVTAIDFTAKKGTSIDVGQFNISRSSDITSALTVNYAITGSAQAGTDYTALSGTITIPAGKSFASIMVSPLSLPMVQKNVILTISNSNTYYSSTPLSAKVNIESDAVTAIFEKDENVFLVYPNPATSFLRIGRDMDYIKICDLNGSTLKEWSRLTAESILELNNLATGSYVISAENGDRKYYKNLMIQR